MAWTADSFNTQVVQPGLVAINLYTVAAAQLVLGTAIQESGLVHVVQIGGGPARGYFQMEPNTHNDIWTNFLAFRKLLAAKVTALLSDRDAADKAAALQTNHVYAAAMCRIHYYRQPSSLPAVNDIKAMAQYWKDCYNTSGGAGTVDEYILNWNRATAAAAPKN